MDLLLITGLETLACHALSNFVLQDQGLHPFPEMYLSALILISKIKVGGLSIFWVWAKTHILLQSLSWENQRYLGHCQKQCTEQRFCSLTAVYGKSTSRENSFILMYCFIHYLEILNGHALFSTLYLPP